MKTNKRPPICPGCNNNRCYVAGGVTVWCAVCRGKAK
jgi:hypothetical protein